LTYLPEGCARPEKSALEAFWKEVNQHPVATNLPPDYEVRWIGLDADSTAEVLDLIRTGDKTGTFTLPWIVARTDQPTPRVGAVIILIDFDGTPALLVRLTDIAEIPFGQITSEHTVIDGSPVRDLSIWKPLHTQYWNAMLAPFGMRVSADMPVWIEKFELLYPDPPRTDL
jgi:uncharacterized protein YhfF